MDNRTQFVVTHNNRKAKRVFNTVQEALSFVYQALDMRAQFSGNRDADHLDRLHSLLNFGAVCVYSYRVDVTHNYEA